MRVLVVDDEEDVHVLFSLVLRTQGHETLRAVNGNEARAVCAAGDIDVLVLDVSLPGEDGPTVLTSLRDAGTVPRVVFLASAITPRALEEMAADIGVRALSKPFTMDTVVRAFDALP